MQTLAPPVVAVVVAHDPGPWFEDALASLGSQDYAELSVLVLDAASADDVTERVASVLPAAYVRRFDRNRGFGAIANEVRSMVDGAAYYLFCHDDVALSSDAVHLLVEEAYRSNAGIVSPKMVSWDDPDRLLHVGMMVDKGGSVVDRVHSHELDHGQHDAVRDVFVAPGGCTLVRADLFDELEGFDPAIVAMGEDLDLCWRAQMAGARVIVAPNARVRHREELASAARAIDSSLVDATDGLDAGRGVRPVTLQELQRRHELLAVFKCYGPFHLARVVPQIVLLAIGEVVVAALAGHRMRTRAVVRAWSWNLRRLGDTRRQRSGLQHHRRLSDKEIRVLQLGGSARLSAYSRSVFQHGFHGAHSDELLAAPDEVAVPDELTGMGRAAIDRAPADGKGMRANEERAVGPAASEKGRLSARVRVTVWVAVALVVIVGSRGLLTGPLPSLGQFAPFPSWTSTFVQFATGWHPSGVGSTAPASPAFALAGVVGTFLLGAMGLTQKILVFGCVPLGAWGVARLVRPFGSQRASVVAAVAYLAMPLPYDALALGRWDALVVYAGAPWVLASLAAATGLPPYGLPRATPSADRPRLVGRPMARSMLALGLLEAVLVSFAPSAALVVILCAAALVLSSCVLGRFASTGQALLLAVGSTVVAGLLCLPWLIGVLSAGRGAFTVLGVRTPVFDSASWGTLLRFAIGPIGVSPLAWGFAAAAALPLVIGQGPRFRWAVRYWSIALVFWFAAWVVGRGWTGSLALDPMVLLGPAALGTAASIGLGIAAFEEDLRAAIFGWRQLATVLAATAVVLGSLPVLVSALPGRWDLPQNDFRQALAWMNGQSAHGAFRVLWLGDARSLNQGSWSAGGGLAYATSENGPPNATWLWNAASPGPASRLVSAVTLARSDRTDQLGSLLAPAGVRYVVVVTALAPIISGVQAPQQYPVPADLLPALGRQLDLAPVVSEGGVSVFENTDWLPERSALPASSTPAAGVQAGSPLALQPGALTTEPGRRVIPGAVPVLPGPVASRSYRGMLVPGTVYAALAPSGRWSLDGPSGTADSRSTSLGWISTFRVNRRGVSTLHFDGGFWAMADPVMVVVLWLLAIGLLLRRRRLPERNPHLNATSTRMNPGVVSGP